MEVPGECSPSIETVCFVRVVMGVRVREGGATERVLIREWLLWGSLRWSVIKIFWKGAPPLCNRNPFLGDHSCVHCSIHCVAFSLSQYPFQRIPRMCLEAHQCQVRGNYIFNIFLLLTPEGLFLVMFTDVSTTCAEVLE